MWSTLKRYWKSSMLIRFETLLSVCIPFVFSVRNLFFDFRLWILLKTHITLTLHTFAASRYIKWIVTLIYFHRQTHSQSKTKLTHTHSIKIDTIAVHKKSSCSACLLPLIVKHGNFNALAKRILKTSRNSVCRSQFVRFISDQFIALGGDFYLFTSLLNHVIPLRGVF